MSLRPVLLILAAVLFQDGCARPPEIDARTGKPLTRIILQTDWYAQAEHGGYYQALVKGYYRDAGLDVTIAQSGPEVPIDLKLATDVVQFCIGRGDDIICQIARDIPVVIVAAQMQHDVQAVLLHRESPVSTFRDLQGKSVMTLPGATWVTYVESTLHIKFNIIPLNFGMAQFMADPNFIQQCFLTNEPHYAEQHGAPAKVLLFSDAGYDFYRVLSGNADWVHAHPEATRAFVQASQHGWEDYMSGDRAAADALILQGNPQMKPEFIEYAVAAMRRYHLVEGDPAKGEAIGVLSRRRLQQQIDILKGIGALDHPITVDDVADFRFTRSN